MGALFILKMVCDHETRYSRDVLFVTVPPPQLRSVSRALCLDVCFRSVLGFVFTFSSEFGLLWLQAILTSPALSVT